MENYKVIELIGLAMKISIAIESRSRAPFALFIGIISIVLCVRIFSSSLLPLFTRVVASVVGIFHSFVQSCYYLFVALVIDE